jgi:hypothetical protein
VEGEDAVGAKKKKLELSLVLAGEPHGGWGRTIRAANAMIQKLSKNSETRADASDLRAHLDLVQLARNLQPQNIPNLADKELHDGLARLQKAEVQFPTACVIALLKRRTTTLKKTLVDHHTAESMALFLECTMPWTNDDDQKVDLQKPCVSCAPLKPKEKVCFFEAQVINKYIVPLVLDGENGKSALALWTGQMEKAVAKVTAMDLEAAQASLHSELSDIVSLCKGLIAPCSEALPYRVQLQSLRDDFGRTGTSATQMLANAVSQTDVHSIALDKFLEGASTLEVLVPEIKEHTEMLKHVGGFGDLCDALKNCTKLITTNTAHAPEGSMSEFCKLVEIQIQDLVKPLPTKICDLIKEKGDIDDDGDEDIPKATEELQAVSGVVQESSLAFPMQSWVVDAQAEIADLITKLDAVVFSSEFRCRLQALMGTFQKKAEPQDVQLLCLEKVIDKASPDKHFQEDKTRQIVTDFLAEACKYEQKKAKPPWKHTIQVARRVVVFARDDATRQEYSNILDALAQVHALDEEVEASTKQDDMQEEWEQEIGKLMRAMDTASTAKDKIKIVKEKAKEKNEEQNAEEENPDTLNQADLFMCIASSVSKAAERLTVVQDKYRTHFQEMAASVEMELKLDAGGDPTSSGGHWMADTAEETSQDWGELFGHYKETLKKARIGDLLKKMKTAEKTLVQLHKYKEFWRTDAIDNKTLRDTLAVAMTTKLSGVMFKILVDLSKCVPNPKMEAARTKLRSEIKETEKKLMELGMEKDKSTWSAILPRALVVKATEVINMKKDIRF